MPLVNPGASPAVPGITTIASVSVFADVRALAAGIYPVLQVLGGTTVGDGKDGVFYWSALSVAADDGFAVLAPTLGGTGRWIRIYGAVVQSGTAPFAESLQSRERWVVYVTDFMSDTDRASLRAGSTVDATTAITNALASLPTAGGLLYFPPGSYRVTASITLKQNIIVRGAGMTATTIVPTTAVTGAVFVYQPASLRTGAIDICDIGFSGNATTLYAISLKNLTLCTLRRIYCDSFSNALSEQVLWDNVQSSQILQCTFLNVKTNGVRLTSTANNNTITGNTFTAASSGNGLTLDPGITQTVVSGNNFEGASLGSTGLTVNGTIATSVVGNFFEFWTGAAIAGNSGTAVNLTIRDNHLHSTDATAAMVVLNSAGPNDRVIAENNYLALLGNGSTATVGFLFGSTTNIRAFNNKSGGAGSGIVSVGGTTQTAADYSSFTNAKCGSFTRDVATATGTQAVTGVGFKPSSVEFFGAIDSSTAALIKGIDDGTTRECVTFNSGTSVYTVDSNNSVSGRIDNANFNRGTVQSFDADGFTISWTKTGTPTGTLTVYYTARR